MTLFFPHTATHTCPFKLKCLSQVWTLRHLDSLASLSLANNPVSSQDYPALVLAHLPHLAYLDHRRVTPQDHADALQLHRYTQTHTH